MWAISNWPLISLFGRRRVIDSDGRKFEDRNERFDDLSLKYLRMMTDLEERVENSEERLLGAHKRMPA